MTFSGRLADYQLAIMGYDTVAKRLPLRSTANQRSKRMRPEDRALDWRLQIEEACATIRGSQNGYTSEDGYTGVSDTDINNLLRLLGEIDD